MRDLTFSYLYHVHISPVVKQHTHNVGPVNLESMPQGTEATLAEKESQGIIKRHVLQ